MATATMQTTVDRLDKPSAYYLGRVRVAEPSPSLLHPVLPIPRQKWSELQTYVGGG